MNIALSKCCDSVLKVSSSDEGTSFYICVACDKACDYYLKNELNSKL